MVVRIFFYQPFNIPSGSMKETLLVGDYLFVSKLSYGYSRYLVPVQPHPLSRAASSPAEPKRGDVVVFKLPRDNSTDYIKRVIGLPGDEIDVRGGVLYINGQAVPQGAHRRLRHPARTRSAAADSRASRRRCPTASSTPCSMPSRTARSTTSAPYKVPAGPLLHDGRQPRQLHRQPRVAGGVGYVPFENLIGRAEIIFFSAAVDEPDAFRWWRPGPGRSTSAGAVSSSWLAAPIRGRPSCGPAVLKPP